MGTQNASPAKLKLLISLHLHLHLQPQTPKTYLLQNSKCSFPFFYCISPPNCTDQKSQHEGAFSAALLLIESHCHHIIYQWEPVHSDSFPWRPCSSFEATKKNCPKGEPCMADLSYAGYVPNNALKCQRSRDRLLEQYQNAKIG